MSNRYIEKSFLYLLVLSLLLHLGAGLLIYSLPEQKPPLRQDPLFVDLSQLPDLPPRPALSPVPPKLSDRTVRVPAETAPRGRAPVDGAGPETPAVPPLPPRPQGGSAAPSPAPHVAPGSSASALLKPARPPVEEPAAVQLFPNARRMARLEESYRRRFHDDIAEGDTRFLNSDDIRFGSFLRRFENAVYGVWRYPQEAAIRGIEGITPVRITFNRRGEIIRTQLLESSGARLLDDEVFRTLGLIGPVGGFPKGYDKEEFHLIAFFQYGGSRRSLR